MTILERFKAPTKSANGKVKAKAKDVRARATEALSQGKDKATSAAKSSTLPDDAKRQLSEALELTLEKVRESATLAKLQDEARRQLTDALDVAREKVRETAPLAKARLEEAGHEVLQHLPHKRKRHSKIRVLMLGFLLVPAFIGVIVLLKKKLTSGHNEAFDAELAGDWGQVPFEPPLADAADIDMPGDSVSAFTATPTPAAPTPAINGNASGKAKAASVATIDQPEDKAIMQDAPTSDRLNVLLGKDVVDVDGKSIGQIERVYYREGEGEPEWAVVSGGLIAKKKATVPLADATIDEKVQIAYPKDQIEGGATFEAEEITVAQEMEADRYYNLHREAAPDVSPNSVASEISTLRAWPAGFEKLPKA